MLGAILLAIAPTLAFQGMSSKPPAQFYREIWVDARNGSDINGNGDVHNPLGSIGQALSIATSNIRTVIILKPGIYEQSSTLVMKKNVSIQGAGALDTVIRGDGEAGALFLFRASQRGAFDDVFVDGVNITFAEIGILIRNDANARFAANPTISNCFITDHGMTAIDIVSVPGGAPVDDLEPDPFDDPAGGFVEHRPKIIHCTFRLSQIGIRNRTSTFDSSNDSWGVNQPGLLNLLFKDQLEPGASNPGDDLQGIDILDTRVTVQGLVHDTVAYQQQGVLLGAPLLWEPSGAAQAPVNAGGAYAFADLFVQDVVSPSVLFPGDLRLNPEIIDRDQFLVDSGVFPGTSWNWHNGTQGKSRFTMLNGAFAYGDVFDFDCEGFGNERIYDYFLGISRPDLGADEIGPYVHAGYSAFRKRIIQGTTAFVWLRLPTGSEALERAFPRTPATPTTFPNRLYTDNDLDSAGTRARKTAVAQTPVNAVPNARSSPASSIAQLRRRS